MAWYHEMFSSLGALVGRRRQEREMDEEVRFHIEMETRRNVEAGLPEREARHRAMRDFGGVERHKDGMRDERGTSWLYDGWNDVRFAARSLRRRAGFTAIATITLALGIGATTTLFGVVKQVLLTPLPYGNPDRIAVVWSAWKGFDQTWLSYDEWEGWKARIPAFADIGLYTDGSVTFDGDSPERIRSANVHANVFPILGVKPIFGRNFTAEEDRPNGPNVVIIGYGLWQRRFGADPAVIGRKVQISGQTSTIVGVMMLIACANVAGLLLVRGESRRRELAVRVALGAGSRRLTRLLLAESGVLAAVGGSLGIGLALLGIHMVRVNAPPGLPRVAETTLDWAVLAFALATAVAAALLAGILPALQATEIAPAGELKEGSRCATTGRAPLP